MTLTQQRRAYLEAAKRLVNQHASMRALEKQLEDMRVVHKQMCGDVVRSLGNIVDDGTLADDGSDIPLRLGHGQYFMSVQDDWHEYGDASCHTAVVTGPIEARTPTIDELLRSLPPDDPEPPTAIAESPKQPYDD